MFNNQGLETRNEERKYLIEIMNADDEEQCLSLQEISINAHGNLSADFFKSINQANEAFNKKINLHALSSNTTEYSSTAFDFEFGSPAKHMKKNRNFKTVEQLRSYANASKSFRDIVKQRNSKVKSSCACIIA